MNEKSCDLYGICNPLIDLVVHVESRHLEELGLVKNSMNLVESERQREILSLLKDRDIYHEAGGSGANTTVLFSQLGGKSAFNGRIGNDEFGEKFIDSLKKNGVFPCLQEVSGNTGSTVILVTEDASRTMNTHLAVSREFSKTDLDEEMIKSSKTLYMTAYCWDTETQKEAALEAFRIARSAGNKVALSLSDPFCVQRHSADLLSLIDRHIDLAIMNFDEASILLDSNDLGEMTNGLKSYLDHFVITLGKKGSLICYDKEIHEIPAYPAEAVDSTGAGDCYAAGYLYGMGTGLGAKQSGHLASFLASQIVAKNGPKFKEDVRALAKNFIHNTLIK